MKRASHPPTWVDASQSSDSLRHQVTAGSRRLSVEAPALGTVSDAVNACTSTCRCKPCLSGAIPCTEHRAHMMPGRPYQPLAGDTWVVRERATATRVSSDGGWRSLSPACWEGKTRTAKVGRRQAEAVG
jgi:hypothetical protein